MDWRRNYAKNNPLQLYGLLNSNINRLILLGLNLEETARKFVTSQEITISQWLLMGKP